MSIDEPQFTYDAKPLTDEQKDALRSAAKKHQWEHLRPVVMGPSLTDAARMSHAVLAGEKALRDAMGTATTPIPRTFTREEVVTVLKAQLATHGTNPAYEIRHLISIFERME